MNIHTCISNVVHAFSKQSVQEMDETIQRLTWDERIVLEKIFIQHEACPTESLVNRITSCGKPTSYNLLTRIFETTLRVPSAKLAQAIESKRDELNDFIVTGSKLVIRAITHPDPDVITLSYLSDLKNLIRDIEHFFLKCQSKQNNSSPILLREMPKLRQLEKMMELYLYYSHQISIADCEFGLIREALQRENLIPEKHKTTLYNYLDDREYSLRCKKLDHAESYPDKLFNYVSKMWPKVQGLNKLDFVLFVEFIETHRMNPGAYLRPNQTNLPLTIEAFNNDQCSDLRKGEILILVNRKKYLPEPTHGRSNKLSPIIPYTQIVSDRIGPPLCRRSSVLQKQEREINIHSRLKECPHVLKLFSHRQIDSKKGTKKIAMIHPFCEGGSLFDADRTKLNLKKLAEQLLSTFVQMKAQNVLHFDLHSDNLLLTKAGDLMVSDFDRSKIMGRVNFVYPFAFSEQATCPQYAPELFNADHKTSIQITWAVDVYSVGIILRDFLNIQYLKMVSNKPKDRPTIEEALQTYRQVLCAANS